MSPRGSTVRDVYRKVMGDAPLAFVETTGGVRVSEDDVVVVGKNDASTSSSFVCYQTNVHRFCRSKLAEQVERRSLPSSSTCHSNADEPIAVYSRIT
jgi:hypothetical protein